MIFQGRLIINKTIATYWVPYKEMANELKNIVIYYMYN